VRIVVLVSIVALFVATGSAHAQQRGTQRSPQDPAGFTDTLVLVNKKLGQQQWAIVADLDTSTVTGNVFNLDGSDPQFLFCDIDNGDDFTDQEDFASNDLQLSCFAAPGCAATPCGNTWQSVGSRTIAGSFFLP
jgi:hypothetical protein